jgi:hypothetical protein
VLGCNGRSQDHGLTFCNSVENCIIEIDKTTEKRNEILNFLDSAGLFDDEIYDWNKVLNIIGFLKDRYGLIDSLKLVEIQMFCRMHKVCGIYLRMDFE